MLIIAKSSYIQNYLSQSLALFLSRFRFFACLYFMRKLPLPSIQIFRLLVTVLLFQLGFPVHQAIAQKDTIRRSIGKEIPDTLLFRLEKVQAAIAQINAANKKGYNLDKARIELAATAKSVNQIKETMQVTNPLPEPKDLINYRIMLTDIQKSTSEWRKLLSKYNADLQRMSEQVIEFSGDSLLKTSGEDTTQRTLYASQIQDLKQRLQASGEVTVANLDSVSRSLAKASAIYFTATDLLNSVGDYLKESDQNLLSQEADFLWTAPAVDKSRKVTKMLKASYAGQDKILRYFFGSTWDNRILLLIVVIAFFVWVNVNFRLIQRKNLAVKIGTLDYKLISPLPIVSTLVILFNLTPLFEPNSPSVYIELNQFFLLITLTILFTKNLQKGQMKWWIAILLLYIVTIFFNIIINESLLSRSGLILLNITSVYFGFRLYKRIDATGLQEKFIKPVLIIHIVLTSIAILLNVFGRLSLAKSFSLTGISGLIHVISMAVLIEIITEAMALHIKVSSVSGGLFSKINVKKSQNYSRRLLLFLCFWLWVMVFLINLNILNPIVAFIDHILLKERAFGSITFTFGNVLFFSIIIYIANQLQKNIGLFFGEADIDFTGDKVQKGSKLALARLVIIVVGVLFAVTASGVPLTKITVLLGALGVGIGLGLQNIINNFVSGIILIFEKPFNIGDYIELADKKGKVLEIGIRSSKMLTPQGSRVIIPNGDLLSGRLVNYTQHDSPLKTELIFKIHSDSDVELAKKLINETIVKGEGVVKKAPNQILFNAITADSIEFKVLVWLNNVYVEPGFKGYFLEQIFQKFKANGIKTM